MMRIFVLLIGLYFCSVGCVKFCITTRSLMEEYSKVKFKGLSELLHHVERDSVQNFIRWRRYTGFNFNQYYRPSSERNKELLVDIIEGKISASAINELVDLPLLINDTGTLKIFFDNPSPMGNLRPTTRALNFTQLPLEERKQLIVFITKKQHRKVYSDLFYNSLIYESYNETNTIVNSETWEFFDFPFFAKSKYSTNHFTELNSLLQPMARSDDFALFRLNALRITSTLAELLGHTEDELFEELRATGTLMQKTIIRFGDRLLDGFAPWRRYNWNLVDWNLRLLSFQSSENEITAVYHHFKRLLKEKKDDSPAFLLELLATTIPLNTEANAFELLEDLIRSYSLERISPFHLGYSLDYFPTLPQKFMNLIIEQFEGEWTRINNDGTVKYYFPKAISLDKF